MSVYTTLHITHSKAMEILVQKVLGGVSDEFLERFMDEQLEHRLYNCIIVPDYSQDNDNAML